MVYLPKSARLLFMEGVPGGNFLDNECVLIRFGFEGTLYW